MTVPGYAMDVEDVPATASAKPTDARSVGENYAGTDAPFSYGSSGGDPPPDRSNDRPKGSGLIVTFADEIGDGIGMVDELVEGLLTRRAMSVIYGDSNSGKTFFGIDVCASIARGVLWMGRNVEKGLVVYLASESPISVKKRMAAYHMHHGILVPNFCIVESPLNLFDGDADTRRVIELVDRVEQERGVKCELALGDTMSRLAAGANENSGEDMSIVVRHADRIRDEAKTHFGFIHHSGKDAARGARGWSGLRAATDTEIEITADPESGLHAAEITKQRDLPGKSDRIGFKLDVVTMGMRKWGRPDTSCVVVGTDAPPRTQSGKRLSEIAGAISEFLTTRGSGIHKRELVKHFDGRHDRSAVYRELRKMAEAGKVHDVAGIVGLRKP